MASSNRTDTDCIIDSLLRLSFSGRAFSEKQEIIFKGRPVPEMQILTKEIKDAGYTRHFQVSQYQRSTWITGSEKLGKLYCWPCLLFANDKCVWNCRGYTDLRNLTNGIHRHERSVSHIRATIQMQTFGVIRIDLQLDDQRRTAVTAHNETVARNRMVLKRLIDITCFLGKQELAFRGHEECVQSMNRGNYVELVALLAEYDGQLAAHLDRSTVFSGTSNRIQNDLIEAVYAVLTACIKDEVRSSRFVAIMADETSDVNNKEQLSMVLRYFVHEEEHCELVERFIGYQDVSGDRTASAISTCVIDAVNRFSCGDKLVAQTYDGAAVMSSELNGVQSKVRQQFPEASFVHCHAHALNLVLSQAAGEINECKIFFATLSGLSAFFTKSTKRTALLDRIVKRKVPNICTTRWNYNSRLVGIVRSHRDSLADLFQEILDAPKDWDNETVASSIGFRNQLSHFQFTFLLVTFSRIFARTEVLFNIMQTTVFDVAYCMVKVQEMKEYLHLVRNDFVTIWDEVEQMVGPPKAKRGIDQSDLTTVYRQLLFYIIDRIAMQLDVRFQKMESLKFLQLLDPKKYKLYTQAFPEASFLSLITIHGKHFDHMRLRNELTVLYDSAEFSGKHTHELHAYLCSCRLHEAMAEVFKLCELISTIPATSASVERSFSALKRIKSYSRNSQNESRLSSLALMSIEKSLLLKLKHKGVLHDLVTAEFIKKSRRADFVYQ